MFNFSVSVMSILQSFVTRRQKLLHLLEINITSQARETGVSLLRLYFNILPTYKCNSNSIDNNLLFKTNGWSSQDEKPIHILVCSTILSQPCKQIRILMVQMHLSKRQFTPSEGLRPNVKRNLILPKIAFTPAPLFHSVITAVSLLKDTSAENSIIPKARDA